MDRSATRDIKAVLRECVVPTNETRHGIVIGIEPYQDSRLVRLPGAKADALAIHRLMTDPNCGMFPEGNVELLLDDRATRERVRRVLSGLKRKVTGNDTVWIYYAGHADFEGPSLCWATHDTDIDKLDESGLSDEEITWILERVKARQVILFLDCCYAGAANLRKERTRRSVRTRRKILDAYKGEGRVIFAGSQRHQEAREIEGVDRGLFTLFLEKGLRGEADSEQKGVVTLGDLSNYLNNVISTLCTTGAPQKPVISGRFTPDVALTLNWEAIRQKEILDTALEVFCMGAPCFTEDDLEFCRQVLWSDRRTAAQKTLAHAFEALAAQAIAPTTLKELIQAARRAETVKHWPANVTSASSDPSFGPSGVEQRHDVAHGFADVIAPKEPPFPRPEEGEWLDDEERAERWLLDHLPTGWKFPRRKMAHIEDVPHPDPGLRIVARDLYVAVAPVSGREYELLIESGMYREPKTEVEENLLLHIWTEKGLRWMLDLPNRDEHVAALKRESRDRVIRGVSWFEAIAFCNWRTMIENAGRPSEDRLSLAYGIDGEQLLDAGFHLPTEAELEIAACSREPAIKGEQGTLEWTTVVWRNVGDRYRFMLRCLDTSYADLSAEHEIGRTETHLHDAPKTVVDVSALHSRRPCKPDMGSRNVTFRVVRKG